MSTRRHGDKKLLLFGTGHLDDMLAKGNVWYVRHWEEYFDSVCVAYLLGKRRESLTNGATTLVSLASGRWLDIAWAPFRLASLARRLRPTHCVTGDVVFSWWTASVTRLFFGSRIYLMPVCMPENIYKTTGKSLSGLPIWLERACIKLSFKAADRVLTGESFGDFVQWLSTDPSAKGKLVVVGALVDALPSIGFFDELRKIGNRTSRCAPSEHEACLVYVGRLHPEKMPSTLIDVMARVKRYTKRKRVVLRIIGDGPELDALEELAARLGVARDIDFVGSVPNEALPSHLLRATIFVSPLTGTALREAALCGLPIVAYDMDWIRGLLEHEKTALLVPPGDVEQMAREVGRLLDDAELWERLSRGATDLAWRLWSPQGVRAALHNAFDEN